MIPGQKQYPYQSIPFKLQAKKQIIKNLNLHLTYFSYCFYSKKKKTNVEAYCFTNDFPELQRFPRKKSHFQSDFPEISKDSSLDQNQNSNGIPKGPEIASWAEHNASIDGVSWPAEVMGKSDPQMELM